MKQIIPAILEKKEKKILEKIKKSGGVFERFHIDHIDESYGNQSILPANWSFFDKFKIGIHLMVSNVSETLLTIPIGGNKIIYPQVEKIKNLDFFKRCKERGFEVGLAVDLETKIEEINDNLIFQVENFLLLSVPAGYSGQRFNSSVLDKIKLLREKVGNNAEIIIDGGINLETGVKCFDCGVNGLAVNSFLWNNFEENSKKLLNLAKKYEI